MTAPWTPPPVPAPVPPPPGTPRAKLREDVADTLKVLPGHFTTKTFIEGLEAGDLFSLNSMLGGSIEIQVVESLNKLRDLWDPTDHWREYRFVRSSQTFPDVRLQTDSPRLIASGVQLDLGYYGAQRGLNRWADADVLITLGDPWPNVGATFRAARVLGLHPDDFLTHQLQAELVQAHGRARAVRRTSPALLLHYGLEPSLDLAPQWAAGGVGGLALGRPALVHTKVGDPATWPAERETLGASKRAHARASMLLAPPLCGVFGVANALAMFAAARPFAMMPAWDARLAAELIERHRVTHMNATDEAVAQLLELTGRTPAYPTLRFVGYAAFNPAMSDMVERAQAQIAELRALGAAVQADELAGKLRSLKEGGLRDLRDRLELGTAGDSMALGRHRFTIERRPLDLALLHDERGLSLQLTGTDYRVQLAEPAAEQHREVWGQVLPNETDAVYRAEYLAWRLWRRAEAGDAALAAALRDGGPALAEIAADEAQKHPAEDYQRGVHDADAAMIGQVAEVKIARRTANSLHGALAKQGIPA